MIMFGIKVVALDLDGTINNNWYLAPLLSDYLKMLQEQDIYVCITSGRDTLGCLYFAKNSGFPFDFVAGGGGSIVRYRGRRFEEMLSDPLLEETVKDCHLSKIDRIKRICKIVDAREDQCLYIDDNPLPLDMAEAKASKLVVASVGLANKEWVLHVMGKTGLCSKYDCTMGVIEVLDMSGLIKK